MKDRLIYATLGAVFGVFIGVALSWLLGVSSHRFGVARTLIDWQSLVLHSAVVFGVLGLLLGEHAGTVIGYVIAALFAVEDPSTPQVPTWFAVIFLIAVAFGVWWFAFR